MTYQPKRLPQHQAAAAVRDLVPYPEAARLLQVSPKTVASWMDRGRLASHTAQDPADGRFRRFVSMTEASAVEAATRRAGKRK